MLVKLLGGPQDGREIDMGPKWPESWGGQPPEVFRVPIVRPMNERYDWTTSASTREIPSADLPVEHWPLHSFDQAANVATYRHPNLKL